MASTTTATVQPTSQNIYGSGKDLSDAIAKYGSNKGYNFVDTSAQGFDPSTMQSGGWMLGGNKVNTNVNDGLLQSKGIHRLAGADAPGTQNALYNAVNNGISSPQSGLKYVYGSGSDLQNAQNIFSPSQGYKLVDVSSPDFDAANMQSGGVMLGGNGVNGNITDDMLSRLNINRVWGKDSADTADKVGQYNVNSLMPGNNDFSFTGSMQDYLDQAQGLLKPQLDIADQSINTQYDTNLIPQANNDTLSRGLARSSYAGNRVDQLNTARSRDLSNALLQNQQQVNNLGLQNYNTAYDRAYNQYNDQFNHGMSLYSTANQGYWQNKNYNADQSYKQQQQSNWQNQFDTSKNQWQQGFDYTKQKDAQAFDLEQQKLAASMAAAAARSSGGGRSSGGSSSTAAKASQSQVDKAAQANFDSLSSVQDQYAMLGDKDFINSVSQSTYKSLQSQYQKNLKAANTEDHHITQSFVSASEPTWDYADSPYTIYSGGR